MKTLLLTLLCIAPLAVLAQTKTYDVAISYGGYTTPVFKQSQFKGYFSADFDYHLTNRWTISSGFMKGEFGYYDDIPLKLANGTYSDKPNSTGFDLHGYAMAKYSLVATPRFTLQAGAGVGFFTGRLAYIYEGNNYEASFANIEFPISLEGYYLISGKIGLGLKAGCFAQPDFPIRGLHFGPQIRIRL